MSEVYECRNADDAIDDSWRRIEADCPETAAELFAESKDQGSGEPPEDGRVVMVRDVETGERWRVVVAAEASVAYFGHIEEEVDGDEES